MVGIVSGRIPAAAAVWRTKDRKTGLAGREGGPVQGALVGENGVGCTGCGDDKGSLHFALVSLEIVL